MQSFQFLLQALLLIAPFAAAQIGGVCDPKVPSQPNPIGTLAKYKNFPTTGTVNGSVAMLPINYTLARSLIPSQYPILKAQYQAWLPSLHADKYPVRISISSVNT